MDALEGDLAQVAATTAEAIERALIELDEAQSMVGELKRYASHDGAQLESVEARLFALRAAARELPRLDDTAPGRAPHGTTADGNRVGRARPTRDAAPPEG